MITLEALIFLVVGLAGGRIINNGLIGGYFNVTKEFLLAWGLTPASYFVDIITIGGFLGSLWLADRGWSQLAKYRYFLRCSLLIVGVMSFFLFFGRIFYGTSYGAHDGVVQSEVAVKMLLSGTNPYDTSFTNTAYGIYRGYRPGMPIDPVLDHYAYPPGVLLLTIPAEIVSRIMSWPIDGRMMTALAYALLVLVLIKASKNLTYRTWIVIFFLANPQLMAFSMIGFNDIFFLVSLVCVALLARRRRWILAGAILGCAVATKQTALLAVPLWIWWLWQEVRQQRLPMRSAKLSIAWMLGVIALVYVPFIIWNPNAFYDDTIRFVSGVIPRTYPIAGDSLYQLMIFFGQAKDLWSPTKPFIGLVLAAMISFPIGAYWIRRRPTASQWISSVVFVTFCTSLANRYFYENYVTGIVLLAAVGMALYWLEQNDDVALTPVKQ